MDVHASNAEKKKKEHRSDMGENKSERGVMKNPIIDSGRKAPCSVTFGAVI